MPSMRADALRNRERLIATAAELFAERGVDVPLEEIARHAGVSIGTLYNHFANRGALLDAVLPDRLVALDRLAEAMVADPDPWDGFAAFMDGLCTLLMHDRSMAVALARNTAQSADTATECGRGAEVLEAVVVHAQRAGALRADFGLDDLLTLVSAMSSVIVIFGADETAWRRHLGFVLDGLRAGNTPPSKGPHTEASTRPSPREGNFSDTLGHSTSTEEQVKVRIESAGDSGTRVRQPIAIPEQAIAIEGMR